MKHSQMELMIVLGIVLLIAIPMYKALLAFVMRNIEQEKLLSDLQRQINLVDFNDPECAELKCLKDNFTRFVGIETSDGHVRFYHPDETAGELRSAIMNGIHSVNANVHIFSKDAEGKRIESKQTVADFVKTSFKLNVLYQPVWSHAMAGLKWGALVGIGLKLIDTAIALFSVEPGAALCLIIAVALCCLPRVGFAGMIVVSLVMSRFYRGNFFMMGIVAGITGAALGCLPGMALGGFIGWAKRSRLPLAPDAKPEDSAIALKAILLPFLLGTTLIALYFYVFNPWLVSILSE